MAILGSSLSKNDVVKTFLKYGMSGSFVFHSMLIIIIFVYSIEQIQQEEPPEEIIFTGSIIDSEQLAALLRNDQLLFSNDEDAVSPEEIPNIVEDTTENEDVLLVEETGPIEEEPVVEEEEVVQEEEPEPEPLEEEPEPEPIAEEPELEPIAEEPEPEPLEEEPEPEPIAEEPEPLEEEPEPEPIVEEVVQEEEPEEEPLLDIDAPVIEMPKEEVAVEETPKSEEEIEATEQPKDIASIQTTMLAIKKAKPEKIKEAPERESKEKIKNKFSSLLKNLRKTPKVKRDKRKKKSNRLLANNRAIKNVIGKNSKLFSQKKLKLKWKIPALSSALRRIYLPQVDEAIGKYWSLPSSLSPSLENIVNVIIARDGKIVSTKFLETSGNPIFDQFVKRVFLKLKSLPPLPESFPGQFTEIALRFTPDRANTN